MKILDSIWFTTQNSKYIGVVLSINEHGEMRAHIGIGHGLDEGLDMEHIVNSGAKFPLCAAIELFPHRKSEAMSDQETTP